MAMGVEGMGIGIVRAGRSLGLGSCEVILEEEYKIWSKLGREEGNVVPGMAFSFSSSPESLWTSGYF